MPPGRSWTRKEEDALAEMSRDRTTDPDIARSLSRTVEAVKKRRQLVKLRTGDPHLNKRAMALKGRPPNVDRMVEAMRLVRIGTGVRAIGRAFGLDSTSASKLLRRMVRYGVLQRVPAPGRTRWRYELTPDSDAGTTRKHNPRKRKTDGQQSSPPGDET